VARSGRPMRRSLRLATVMSSMRTAWQTHLRRSAGQGRLRRRPRATARRLVVPQARRPSIAAREDARHSD
jgi:hypothetical protein